MIELKHIYKTYYRKKKPSPALVDVSLSVQQGEVFGVIGASGAGKSTLIRCVNLLERPDSGEVIVDGESLLQLPARELTRKRRDIGMIFQHFNLLSSRTVYENIAFPLELGGASSQQIDQRVNELLDLVGLRDKRNDHPANLSGGQKQRVAIARTLASNPKVLLCDEATSALDPETTRSILALLKDINRRFRITILLITHEMDVVKSICDRVAVISEGQLIEQGTVGEIFADPKSEITRQFISSSIHLDIPADYASRLKDQAGPGLHPLVKLQFTGATTSSPVLSEASRLFGIDNLIITAQLDRVGDIGFGVLLAEIRGEAKKTEEAIVYYRDHHIKAEILGYV